VSVSLRSFDGTEQCTSQLEEPDRYSSLFRSLEQSHAGAVRGAGLSYCLASAGDDGTSVSMRRFDRILHVDVDARTVTVEPGLTVGALNDFALARGRYFPVLPGHPSITVGGCAGFNVHGKTQHNVGLFSDHVVALTLFHPDRGELRCRRGDDDDLLQLTLGGMGLTGCITDITLELQPLPGAAMRRIARPVANLCEAVDVMRAHDADALYSWNDLNLRGSRFGAGVVYEERFEPVDVASRTRYRALAPGRRSTPPWWSAGTVRAMNRVYPWRDALRSERLLSVHDAAFPINGNEAYFAGFGRRGFREYQMIVTHDAWTELAAGLERAIVRTGVTVTLGSLKLFAGDPQLMWFVGNGVCVTVDVAAGPEAAALFRALDELAVAFEARVNVSKDSRLPASTAAAVFPEYDTFRTRLEQLDPKRRFATALRRRLEL